MDNKELIERYLMGKLSFHELSEIEKKIKADPIFYEELNFQRDILIGINESRRLQLKEKLRNIKSEPKIVRLHINKNIFLRYGIAASITIIVTLSVLYPKINDALIIKSKKGYSILK